MKPVCPELYYIPGSEFVISEDLHQGSYDTSDGKVYHQLSEWIIMEIHRNNDIIKVSRTSGNQNL